MPASDRTQTSADPLLAGFVDPPQSARPRTWWHWMNGNVTQEGIARDLEWMNRIGLGGIQNFDASLTTPQIVDERLIYMSPEWREAFRFAVSEADRHGLEFAIAASPGWSETGGPWVEPADGMKKLTWSETVVPGGERFHGRIAAAPTETGPYQDAPFEDELAMVSEGSETQVPTASGRIAVLAVPLAYDQLPISQITLADGTALDFATLTDGRLQTTAMIPLAEDLSGEVLIEFPRAVTVRSANVAMPGLARPFRGVPIAPVLQVEGPDGWRDVAALPLTGVPTTASFDPATARRFRLAIAANPAGNGNDLDAPAPGAQSFDIFALGELDEVPLAELRLSSEVQLDALEQQAGFGTVLDYTAVTLGDSSATIDPAMAIDLSDRVATDGSLDWTPPPGRDWRILNFGWSLTGKTNHPATPEATGLEVDKLDPAAVRRYLETYLGMYRETLGPDMMGDRGLTALLTDSIEVGAANWTPQMETEFAARRGYALRPWLPALAGAVLGSPAETERFLHDWRETLAEMLAEYHYGTIAEVAHEHGLRVYGEALENGRPMLGDDLAMRRYADVPMAAMWTYARGNTPRQSLIGDMRGAASIAHVYGQNLVAAESMTAANAPWDFAPRDLRRIIDFEFANGVNLPVIHTSVHVPVEDRKPGLSLMIFGQYFNRNETWAEMAGPWIDYIARNAFMLQQGRAVADVAVFAGEEAPLTAQYAGGVPAGLPRGYGFDYVNADMLRDAVTIDGNELVSTGGARYRALQLAGSSDSMTLSALARVAEIARAGIPVIGTRPRSSPSLLDDQAAFETLAAETWALPNVTHAVDIDAALGSQGLAPDFSADGTWADQLAFFHRRSGDADIYFVANRCACAVETNLHLRSSSRAPQWWDAVNGETRELSFTQNGDVTTIPLALAAEQSGYVVFRDVTAATSAVVPPPSYRTLSSVDGEWTVAFQPGRGAPAQITMASLQPLDQSDDPSIRYFSGVATYTTTFSLSAMPHGERLVLDLGQVGDIAEVSVNGIPVGTTWFAPDRVDFTDAARAGENVLEVRVANRWANRLIGDVQPGAEPVTFVAAPTYRPDAPLRPAGLIGPVRILARD
ncbi:glycosyl hydrolase [Aurantiacibacter arachoides]|nr:glycosyl hydrolase [Aurantiacibacter arachoides]